MLAGCSSSSTLLSPRHRVRSEAPSPKNFQARHFPAMNTAQRLDLPCTASFAVAAEDSKPKPAKASSCSLRQSIRLPPLATTRAAPAIREDYWNHNINNSIDINNGVKRKSLKRLAEELCYDEAAMMRRIKRRRSVDDCEEDEDEEDGEEEDEGLEEEDQSLELGQFWLNPQLQFPLTCSGTEEDREEESFEEQNSPFPWIEEIADLGEREARIPTIGGSSSASSAEIAAGNGNRSNIPIPNPNPNPRHYQHHQIVAIQATAGGSGPDNGGGGSEEAEGMEMVSLVASCLEAMAAKSVQGIGHCIARLGGLASPWAAGTLHRLMAYYTEALALRAARVWPHVFHLAPPRDFERFSTSIDDDSSPASALRILNQMSPIPRFIHFTANEMLLQAFEGRERVHVIDFDIKQGLQWPSLLQSIASRRPGPPSHVRITGVGESKQELNDTGDRLAAVAAALNLPFEFHAVVDRLEDVRLWMLHVSNKDREAVGVNLALQLHRTLYDSSGSAIRDFLGLVRSANPTVVVVAEQESDLQGGDSRDLDLESRVSASLRYYSAVFDAVASGGAAPESAARVRVEEMFGREIRNLVACEGFDRLERHVGFATWRRIMEEQGGFRHVAAGISGAAQARMLLRMYGWSGEGQNGYFIRESEEGSGVTLGWRDQPLFTVSAWSIVPSA